MIVRACARKSRQILAYQFIAYLRICNIFVKATTFLISDSTILFHFQVKKMKK